MPCSHIYLSAYILYYGYYQLWIQGRIFNGFFEIGFGGDSHIHSISQYIYTTDGENSKESG